MSPLSASDLHQRGVDAANARRFAAARKALLAAAARTDDEDLRARIDGTLAYVLAQTGEPAEAERLIRDVLAREGIGAQATTILLGQLGTLLLHAGRIDEAERMLSRAIEASASEDTALANLLVNRSVARMQQHALDACRTDLERAIAVFEANSDVEPLAEAQHNLGYAALLGGDLVKALSLMDAARPTLAETGDLAAAISDLDRAEVLRDAGETSEAERLLSLVAARFGAQRMRQARGEAEFHLARSQLRHAPQDAARTAATAARRFASLGSAGWAARADGVRLEARVRAGLRQRAEELDTAASALRRHGLRTDAVSLALTARSLDSARLPRVPPGAPMPLRIRSCEVRAQRAASSGRHTEARRIAADGLDLLHAWRRSFGALDLRASSAVHSEELLRIGLTAAARAEDPAVLFEWSERARHLSQQVTPLRPPRDEALAADLAELRMLRAELIGDDWLTDPEVLAIRDRVRERQWSSTGGVESHDRLGLREVRARMPEGTALAAFVFTGSALSAIVATASGARMVRLSWPSVRAAMDGLRADLDVFALTRGGPMSTMVERSLHARLTALDALLLRPVREAMPDARRLALTAPGVLAGIPWAMLPGMAGVPFTLAASASRWLEDRPLVGARIGFAAGPRVPRAFEEITASASSWGTAELLSGADASVEAVMALAGRSDVLHVAAHGRHTVDNPLFSGLELADGTLFGYDVDLIDRPPATVILSACELGRSSVRGGEEAVGMTRVWLHAGARCVIASPVTVRDDIAAELLPALHEGLAAGQEPAAALASASDSTRLHTPFQAHGSGF
ncbi:CHAT domain-containing protein [Microbacterium sp. NPDC055903]